MNRSTTRIGLAVAGFLLGFIFGCDKLPTPPASPTPGVWYSLWGSGQASHLTVGEPYVIPGDGGYVGYLQTAESGKSLSLAGSPGAVSLTFTLAGAAGMTAAIPDKYSIADIDPAALRLFIELPDDNFTLPDERWWCGASKIDLTADGTYTVSCPLTYDQWSDVDGVRMASQKDFDAVLSLMQYAGFTFGGQEYAGHGVGCTKKPCTFTLDSWKFE